MIDIVGLDKAEVLLELYNHSHQQGLGNLYPLVELTVEDAKKILKEERYRIDSLYGKPISVDLSNDEEFDESIYDAYIGQGMAQLAVDAARKRKKIREGLSEPIVKGFDKRFNNNINDNIITSEDINNINTKKR